VKGGAAPSIPGEYLRQGDEAVLESAAAQDTGDLPNSDVRKLDTVQGDLEEIVEQVLRGADGEAHWIGAISR